jgi:hypothetical protein
VEQILTVGRRSNGAIIAARVEVVLEVMALALVQDIVQVGRATAAAAEVVETGWIVTVVLPAETTETTEMVIPSLIVVNQMTVMNKHHPLLITHLVIATKEDFQVVRHLSHLLVFLLQIVQHL